MATRFKITAGRATTVKRSAVKVGEVFRSKSGDRFAAVGVNGHPYSYNLDKDRLDWNSKSDPDVTIIGTFTWDLSGVNANNPVFGKTVARGDVAVGQVFQAKKDGKLYAHLGEDINGSLFSAVLNGSGNHAVTDDDDKNVTLMGTWGMQVTTV